MKTTQKPRKPGQPHGRLIILPQGLSPSFDVPDPAERCAREFAGYAERRRSAGPLSVISRKHPPLTKLFVGDAIIVFESRPSFYVPATVDMARIYPAFIMAHPEYTGAKLEPELHTMVPASA